VAALRREQILKTPQSRDGAGRYSKPDSMKACRACDDDLGSVLFSDTPLRSSHSAVIWRPALVALNIGMNWKNLRRPEHFFRPQEFHPEEPAMIANCAANDGFEISPRFRRTIEERIARLERDAVKDEAQVDLLEDGDHIRRQMRLVVMQRSEALRMRLFLDRAKTRLPRPLIAL